MDTSFLDRGGSRIAYDVQGEGPLVVCLPGMGDLRSVYRFLTPALASAGYRVATMDLRGHGDSDDAFDTFDDVAAGRDALALVAHLGGPALLVGNSMGAAAAVWAAAEDPSAVAGLVLLAPSVRDGDVGPLMTLAYRLLLVKPWGPGVWRAYYRKLYPAGLPEDLDAHVERIRESLSRGHHWRSFVETTRTSHAPAAARLEEVRSPALVVMGEEDPEWPDPGAEARWVAETLGADLLMVPGAGHYPMADHPDVVSPQVRAFGERVFADA